MEGSFFHSANEERANFGTYLLTITIVLLGLIVGQVIAELFATKFFGFSLMYIPKNVSRNVILSLLMVPFISALAALLFSLRTFHKRRLITVFTSRDRFDWGRFALSASIWLAIMVILLAVSIGTGSAIELNLDWSRFIPLILISFFILPFQTAAEDLFYRGFLFQGLGRIGLNPLLAVLLVGLLFGMSHAGNPEVDVLGNGVLVYYIMTGVFLGLLTHYDDGMELGMGYHFANNLFGVLILTNDWQALQTDALMIDRSLTVFGWDSLLVIAVLQPILFFTYARIYKWKKSTRV